MKGGGHVTTAIIIGIQFLALYQAMTLLADAVAKVGPDGIIEIFVGQPRPANKEILGLLAGSSLQMGVFLPVLAAVMAGQEFKADQLGVTILAMPRRGSLLFAKMLAAALYLLGVALLIAAISTAFLYAAIQARNPGLLLTDDALLTHAKFILFAVLFSLTVYGITIIVRSAFYGIIAGLVFVIVTMTQGLTRISPALDALFPLSAGRNLLLDPIANTLTAGWIHALFVLIGWAAASIVLAGILLGRRDAR